MTTIAVAPQGSILTSAKKSARFAKNWLAGASESRSARRRLNAILRNACRALGLKRGKGLGMLGVGNQIAGAAVIAAMLIGFAPQANAAGGGIMVNVSNDPTDGDCTALTDTGWVPILGSALHIITGHEPNVPSVTSENCKAANKTVQTGTALFYSAVPTDAGSVNSLSLGGELFVNSGKISLGGGNPDGAMAIGNTVGSYVKQDRLLTNAERDGWNLGLLSTYVDARDDGTVLRYRLNADGTYTQDQQGDYIQKFGRGGASQKVLIRYEKDLTVSYAPTTGTSATGKNAMAFGNDAKANGEGATALGHGALASAGGALALGNGAQAVKANSVALGSESETSEPNQVSVGNANLKRKISNVADGVQDDDAVTLKQLNKVAGGNGLVQLDTTQKDLITVGKDTGGRNVDVAGTEGTRLISGVTAGKLEQGSNEVATAGQVFDTNEDVKKLDGRVADNTTKIENVDASIKNISEGKEGLVKYDPIGKKLTVGADKDATTVDITGTNKQTRVLAGLTDGAASNDAATFGQVRGVSQSVAAALGGGAKFGDDGKFMAPTYSISSIEVDGTSNDGNYTDVGTAFSSLNTSVGNINTHVVNIDDKVTKNTAAINTRIDGVKSDSIQWDTAAGAFSATHGANPATGARTPRKITNLADGDITKIGSTDAVNGSQLFATNAKVTKSIADIANTITKVSNLTDGKAGLVQQDGTGLITIGKDAPVGVSTISVFGPQEKVRKITGVAVGELSEKSPDAVTGSQLYWTGTTAAKILGGGASLDQDGRITKPTYNLKSVSADGKVSQVSHDNVGTALGGLSENSDTLNTRITDIRSSVDNTINSIINGTTGLVLQDATSGAITIGKGKAGTVVDLTGTDGFRTLSGVKNGVASTDAVNFGQLDNVDKKAISATEKLAGLKKDTVQQSIDDAISATTSFGGVDLTQINTNVSNLKNDALQWDATAGTVAPVPTVETGAGAAAPLAAPTGAFSAKHGGKESRITHLAAGDLSEKSSDAVNGSQLFTTNTKLNTVGNSAATTLGKGASFDVSTGQISLNYTLKNGGDQTTILGGLNALDSQVDTNTKTIATNTADISRLNSTITNINGGTVGLVQQSAAGENLTVGAATDGDAVDFKGIKGPRKLTGIADGEVSDTSTDAVTGKQLNKLDKTALKFVWNDKNGNGVLDEDEIDTTKMTLAENGKDGTNGVNGTIIENVKGGKISDDSLEAVNGGQLNKVVKALGGEAGFDVATGAWTAPKYDIKSYDIGGAAADNSFDNVGQALAALNANDKVFNERFTGVDTRLGGVDNRLANLDKKIDYLDKHTLQANKDGHFSALSETSGENKVPLDKLIGDGSTSSTIKPADTTSAAIPADTPAVAGGAKITGLKDAELSATSTDAVTGKQLNDTNKKLDGLGTPAVKLVTGPNGEKTNLAKLEGGDPNAPVLISNLAEGKEDNDAVNVKQLKAHSAAISNEYVDQSKTYTNTVTANTLNEATSYTDSKLTEVKGSIANVNGRIDNLEDGINKGFAKLSSDIGVARKEAYQAAAIGLAASSLRFDSTPGKISVAMGGGVWRDQAAMAFGAGYTSESGKVRANVTGATSNGEIGVGAGLSFTLN